MITHARILTTDVTDPHLNLATEDALLQSLPKGQAMLFLWQNRHTVVIGAGQNAWRECHTQRLQDEGGTLARRSSGGGAVYHDLGNLNFSFIVPRGDYDVARQLRVVLDAVRALGIDAQASGRNDLTASGRKFSGNAFRLLKHSALHHGTLLVHVDMALLGRYLNVDPLKMRAKGVQSVPARVVNLSDLVDVSVEAMRSAMIDAFVREYGPAGVERAEQADLPMLRELLPRYRSWDWNYGASPAGEINLSERFDWGALELSLTVKAGRLDQVQAFTDAMDETLHLKIQSALAGTPFRADELAGRVASLGLADVARFLEERLS